MREIHVRLAHSDLERMGFGEFEAVAAGQREPVKLHLLDCTDDSGVMMIEAHDPVDEATVEAIVHVTEAKLVSERPGSYEYLVEMESQPFCGGFLDIDSTLFFKDVIVLNDQGLEFTLVTDNETLQRLREHSEEEWGADTFDCTIQRVTEYTGLGSSDDKLTDRQREVIAAAYADGYYEIPRESSSEELADRLGLEKSTFLEHLRRAERNLVAQLVERENEVVLSEDIHRKKHA